MDLQDYVNILNRTEKDYDVNKYRHKGIILWPIYRSQTIGMFRNPDNYFAASKRPPVQKSNLKNYFLNIYYAVKFKNIFGRELRKVLKKEDFDVLLYSKYSAHTDQVNEKWYDRFVDPFYEKLKDKYKLKKIELSVDNSGTKSERAVETVILNQKYCKDYFYYKYKNKDDLNLKTSLEEISRLTGINYVAEKVNSSFYEINYYKEFFTEVFKIIKPRFVFLKCYYENDSMGLILAAREAGIKTIDIQHGKQGVYHPMYTHFTKIPGKGYQLLPDYFWNWGEESVYNIESWQNNKLSHKAIVGGNLWLAKWKNSEFFKYRTKEEEEFVNSLKTYQRTVLYAIQPLDKSQVFPEHVIKAIHASPENWIWLLRVHPFQKLSEKEILELIGNPKVKVEVQYSTSLPLYKILKHVSHHITLWSSTCFEANDFDVPTIITHEFGRKLYEEYINKGVFLYSTMAENILELLKGNTQNIKTNYIETNNKVIEEALEKIGLPI